MKVGKKTKICKFPNSHSVGVVKLEDGRVLRSDERRVVEKLLSFGCDVVCKKESKISHRNTADIVWKGDVWEIKVSKVEGKYTVVNRLRKGKRQSGRIVLDISESKKSVERIVGVVEDFVRRHKTVKTVVFISGNKYCVIGESAL